jgi:hypothetical protein
MSSGYIDGIFNYCDRWCERCPLTARCRVFAFEEELKRTDDENAAFWKVFEDLREQHSEQAAEFLAELSAVGDDESLIPELQPWDSDADEFERIADKDPLAKFATDYGLRVHRWLKQHDPRWNSEEAGPKTTATSPEEVSLNDALEVIGWYSLQIGVKLTRALSGEHELQDYGIYGPEEAEEEETDLLDEVDEFSAVMKETARMERDGSAKVSLIGVERSLGAWTIVRTHFPDQSDAIREFQRMLGRIRRAIDERIPGARTLQRPGFEYEV